MTLDISVRVALIHFLGNEWNRRKSRDLARLNAWANAHPENAKIRQQRYNKTDKAKLRLRRYSELHPDRIKQSQKKYSETDKAKIRSKNFAKNNPESRRASEKKYRASHVEKTRTIWRNAGKRRYADKLKRVVIHHRNRIRMAVASQGQKMPASASKMIGCDWPTLRAHLESRFQPGMSWDNYGPGWHVDHIKPIASFDLNDPEQMKACFHYTNLQPLFALDNLRKGDKLDFVVKIN